jgi:CubicO group peptidase (beta-lactamase class C family)
MVLGSLSKGITALMVMQMEEAGKIDLDAPTQRYLPWLVFDQNSLTSTQEKPRNITIRHLLHQTSGIPGYAGADTLTSRYTGSDALENQIRSLSGIRLAHLPGETYEYSNANYDILGLIVQTVSGESFASYAKKHVFEPLKMTHSYAQVGDVAGLATGYQRWFGQPIAAPDIPVPLEHVPSAFIISNAEDMGHYLLAMMNGGRYCDTQILSSAGIKALQSPVASTEFGNHYGMGWVVWPEGTLIHHGGTATFSSTIMINGDLGVFLVRNITGNQNDQRFNETAANVVRVLRGQAPVKNVAESSLSRNLKPLIGLCVIQTLLLVGLLVHTRRLLRNNLPNNHSLPSVLLTTGLPCLIALGLATILFYKGIFSSHLSASVQFQYSPDLMLLLTLNIGLALIEAFTMGGRELLLWSTTKTERPLKNSADR